MATRINEQQIMALVNLWQHQQPKEEFRKFVQKYGLPGEVTNMRAVWYNAGPWKRIMIVDEEVPHGFPMPHMDYVYQWVTYDVPVDKTCDLLRFDKSVLIDIPKRELGSRCHFEVANFLTVNLANDIITGKRSWQEAQQIYREALKEQKHPEYTSQILFAVPTPA